MEKLPAETMDRFLAGAEATRGEAEQQGERGGKTDTGISCVTSSCQGTIVEEVSYHYFGDVGRMIIGPGAANQMTRVVELYCSRCGISYHHLPGSLPA